MFSHLCVCMLGGGSHAVADLRGRPRHAPSPTAQKVLNFMQVFFGNFMQNPRLAPPLGGLAPSPMENPGSVPAM